MDFNQVKELIGIIDSSTLTEMELKIDNVEVRLSKNSGSFKDNTVIQKSNNTSINTPKSSEDAVFSEPITIIPETKKEIKEGFIVTSPIVGVFYESSAPGKDAFVKIGAGVSKGSLLCIVEAMKVMNEIQSEYTGTVAEIFVKDGDMVEFEQPLFRIV